MPHKDRATYNEYMRNYMAARYQRRRDALVASLGAACVDCGTADQLELDHADKTLKRFDVGERLAQKEADGVATYASDMAACLKSLASCTRRGTPVAFVVGDSIFHGEVVDNARLLIEAGRASGFRCIAHAQRAIHPVKRSMIGPARRARIEHIVLLVRGK